MGYAAPDVRAPERYLMSALLPTCGVRSGLTRDQMLLKNIINIEAIIHLHVDAVPSDDSLHNRLPNSCIGVKPTGGPPAKITYILRIDEGEVMQRFEQVLAGLRLLKGRKVESFGSFHGMAWRDPRTYDPI